MYAHINYVHTCNTQLYHIVESIFNTVMFNLFISMLQLVNIQDFADS